MNNIALDSVIWRWRYAERNTIKKEKRSQSPFGGFAAVFLDCQRWDYILKKSTKNNQKSGNIFLDKKCIIVYNYTR